MLDRNPEAAFRDQPTGLPLDCHGVSVAGAAHSVNQDDYLLAPLGIVHIDLPLTPERVWGAIQSAQKRS